MAEALHQVEAERDRWQAIAPEHFPGGFQVRACFSYPAGEDQGVGERCLRKRSSLWTSCTCGLQSARSAKRSVLPTFPVMVLAMHASDLMTAAR